MAFPWGAAIGAAGSVLGGLLGGSETIGPGKALKQTVKAARKVGIHPLAALGTTSAYQKVGNGFGDAVAKGAAELGRALPNSVDKSVIDVNSAQADLLRVQANAVTQEMRASTIGGTTGARNISNPNKPTGLGAPTPDGELPKIFVPEVIGTKGQKIKNIANMDTAPDAETTIMARVEDGSFFNWAEDLIARNIVSTKQMEMLVVKAAVQAEANTRKLLKAQWEKIKSRRKSSNPKPRARRFGN